jgi:hypothetical protein
MRHASDTTRGKGGLTSLAADWSQRGNCDGITLRCDVIGVAPTIHPRYSPELANRFGAFFFFPFVKSTEIVVVCCYMMRHLQ